MTPAPVKTERPIFAADDGLRRAGARVVCTRSIWRDTGLAFGRELAEVRRLDVEPVAALDVLRERDELVAVLPLACRGLDLPPLERSAVFGPLRLPAARDAVAAAGFFDAPRPAAGFCRVGVRSLAGTSVMSTSPSSDTGRSATRPPSSSPSSASGAS